MKIITYLFTIVFIFIITVVNAQQYGSFSDSRDGNIYRTVKIGNQVWMAENLAYKVNDGCWAYNNDQNNVSTCGYLYDWETSKKACPKGWHLPSDAEWSALIDYLGGENIAGEKMKVRRYTDFQDISATNSSGFNVFLGGYYHRYEDKKEFLFMKYQGCYWSSTESTRIPWTAKAIKLQYEWKFLVKNEHFKEEGFSVRCVCDNNIPTNTIIANNSSPQQTSGCISGDCYNGYGTYIYNSGVKYDGDFKDGTAYGKENCIT